MMLLSAGFLMRTIGSADAAPTPEKFLDQGTSQIGRYQILETVSPAYKDANGNFVLPIYCGSCLGYPNW